ncbi:MAG: glutathione peroxidase [Candidatus Izemoplasmatales bacterium]|jgi:glutathione peroxidase|nr:glutathione peroxidase [Candidatus Izemoplasmatales bacterium]
MSVYDYSIKNIEREDVKLDKFKGKVLLIFNSATKCGYTPQYKGIQELYEKYRNLGLEVIDLPCNQFLNQAPGSDEEIAGFCQANYHTTFETYSKIKVNGDDAIELFKYLKRIKPVDETPGYEINQQPVDDDLKSSNIKWNFTKFIIDRNGNVFGRYASKVKPEELASVIEKLL